MARDRKGAQLNLEVEPQLLERLRARAAADDRPLAALVRRWLEAGLAGALEQQAAPAGPDLADLAARVGWLEAELAQLRNATPKRVAPAPRTDEPVTPNRVIPDPPPGAITTAELAELTGASRGAWNRWATRAAPGDVRHHPQAGSWRLVGKAALDAGGPARWMWEQA
jgi:plasmid stability protein